jgi:RNA polymerase sigma-70 factor (ECF subfamily)
VDDALPFGDLAIPREAAGPEELDRLAVLAGQGDRAAFNDIYLYLVDDLFRFVRGQTGDDTEAEDILADVFLKAWRGVPRYRAGSGKFRPWIFAIARNEVRRYWRSRPQGIEPLTDDVIDDPDEPGNDPELTRRFIFEALSVLTDEQREVVVLRFFGEHDHAAIARTLGKREGAVRALLLRALRRMRREMAHAKFQE